MSTSFAEIVEDVKALSLQEKQELHQLIEKYLIEATREEIYEGFVLSQTECEQGNLEFSSDTDTLRRILSND